MKAAGSDIVIATSDVDVGVDECLLLDYRPPTVLMEFLDLKLKLRMTSGHQ